MTGRTNAACGDRLKNAFAIITVSYPAGSSLTCSNGTKTYKAGNTYGAWAFGVNAAGTWTITAADGAKTKSVSVEITAEGQCESISLQYQLELLKNGVLANGYEFGFTAGSYSPAAGLTVNSSSECGFCLKENCKVAVNEYSTLRLKVGAYPQKSSSVSIGLYDGYNTSYIGYANNQQPAQWAKYGVVLTSSGTPVGIAKQEILPDTEYAFDISALDGEWAVKLSGYNINITITDIIFE